MSTALLVMWMWMHGQALGSCLDGDVRPISATEIMMCSDGHWEHIKQMLPPGRELVDVPAAQGHMTAQNWNVLGDCKTNAETGTIDCRQYAPVDVPAEQRVRKEANVWSEERCNLVDEQGNPYVKNCKVSYEMVTRWTCSDKSRILLTAEDGSKHCIKFGGR